MAIATSRDGLTTVSLLPAPAGGLNPDRPGLSFAKVNLQPPTEFWVTPDDVLVVGIRNSLVGVTVSIQARLWTQDGELSNPNFTVGPPADRALRYTTVPLSYGYLTSVVAFATGSPLPKRGQTYVSIQVVRTPNQAFSQALSMGAAYLAGSNFIQWPYSKVQDATEGNGLLREVIGTVPAAGADWLQAVPANARWRVHGVTAELVTSAVVANRQTQLRIDDGVNIATFETVAVLQTAGQTLFYNFIPGYPSTGVTVGSMVGVHLPLFADMDPGWRLSAFTSALDAGDQWSNIRFWVEEWLED